MSDMPSIEELITQCVEKCFGPRLDRIERVMMDIRKGQRPDLLDVARLEQETGVSQATWRRRIREGAVRTVRVGSRVLVDASSLVPVDDAEINEMARRARAGR